jgi:hypothetical protein
MKLEIWKPYIEGYYECSTFGRIRSVTRIINSRHNTPALRKGRVCKLVKDTKGYLVIRICIANIQKTVRVHRIIAEVFIPNPENKPTVNHKDLDRTNNNVENLEWATVSENIKHSQTKGRALRQMHLLYEKSQEKPLKLTAVN